MGELFWPPEQGVTQRIRDQFFAAAHDRLSQPLYCIAFALIALAAVMRGRRQRGSVAIRLTIASLAAAGLRIAGYGVMGLAQRNPAAGGAFLSAAGDRRGRAIALLAGYTPRAMLARLRSRCRGWNGRMSWSWTLYRYLAVQFLIGVIAGLRHLPELALLHRHRGPA